MKKTSSKIFRVLVFADEDVSQIRLAEDVKQALRDCAGELKTVQDLTGKIHVAINVTEEQLEALRKKKK